MLPPAFGLFLVKVTKRRKFQQVTRLLWVGLSLFVVCVRKTKRKGCWDLFLSHEEIFSKEILQVFWRD
jgi:hypothetical protein